MTLGHMGLSSYGSGCLDGDSGRYVANQDANDIVAQLQMYAWCTKATALVPTGVL
jgi:hypothetical protein